MTVDRRTQDRQLLRATGKPRPRSTPNTQQPVRYRAGAGISAELITAASSQPPGGTRPSTLLSTASCELTRGHLTPRKWR